ncbi:MAG: GDSL-type esterase/lipase family protein [Cyclobacteriaceae bacterium]|nr:hypothetical protein [Cyclobacteriaceae bacterium]MCH8517691.1 GDSL-type esterase/lipase family protein [Cyclobacteriaceae bacterium]
MNDIKNKSLASLLFLLFLVGNEGVTQESIHKSYPYSFIDLEANHLDFSEANTFEALFDKMNLLYSQGEGQINMAHFGGSHIQADIYTGRFRELLFSTQAGVTAGRGYVFPYAMAKTNNPITYFTRHSGNWDACRNVQKSKNCTHGMGGIYASTTDLKASFSFHFYDQVNAPSYLFDRIKIYHNAGSGYELRVSEDQAKTLSQRYVAEGGYTEVLLDRQLSTVEVTLDRVSSSHEKEEKIAKPAEEGKFILYGASLESMGPGFTYHSMGINGASVPSYLESPLLPSQLATLDLDLVIFAMGINDANVENFDEKAYEQNYVDLIDQIRAFQPDLPVILIVNNDSYFQRTFANKNVLKARRAMYEVQRRRPNVAVYDFFKVMGGLNSIDSWYKMGLAKADRIHFTRPGYRMKGELFFSAFWKAFEDYNRQLAEAELGKLD